MKLYISGPMTGLPGFNAVAFNKATRELRRRGLEAVNPVEVCSHLAGADWRQCMREDLSALLGCDGIVVLEGWHESRGALLECHIGRELDMPIVSFAWVLESTNPLSGAPVPAGASRRKSSDSGPNAHERCAR